MGKAITCCESIQERRRELTLPFPPRRTGHLAVQYAVAIGLRVVGIDTGADKRKLLDQYGAEGFIDFKDFKDEGALIKEVKRVCGGEGPHVSAGQRCAVFF